MRRPGFATTAHSFGPRPDKPNAPLASAVHASRVTAPPDVPGPKVICALIPRFCVARVQVRHSLNKQAATLPRKLLSSYTPTHLITLWPQLLPTFPRLLRARSALSVQARPAIRPSALRFSTCGKHVCAREDAEPTTLRRRASGKGLWYCLEYMLGVQPWPCPSGS
jgi:hypothetical protein